MCLPRLTLGEHANGPRAHSVAIQGFEFEYRALEAQASNGPCIVMVRRALRCNGRLGVATQSFSAIFQDFRALVFDVHGSLAHFWSLCFRLNRPRYRFVEQDARRFLACQNALSDQRADEEIGRAASDVEQKLPGAEGRLAQAESRHAELLVRRDRRCTGRKLGRSR